MDVVIALLVVLAVGWFTALLHRMANSLDEIRGVLIEIQDQDARRSGL